MLLRNKVALITGASRGIGAATAQLYAEHGATVALNYLKSHNAAERVVASIEEHGGRALALRADVTEATQVRKMVAQIEEELGPIDILVLNAGFPIKVAPFSDFTWEDFEAKLVQEMKGAFFCCKAIIPSMVERKSGSIVALSSNLSRQPGTGFIAHSTSKASLNAFIQTLARELGPCGVRANIVSPGFTLTDATSWFPEEQKKKLAQRVPLRRNGLPDDLAGPLLFFASDLSRFITGGYLPVDGGMTML